MVEAGFEGIRTYITRRQNTVAQYIAMLPIMDLCERSSQRPGLGSPGVGGNSTV